MIKSKAGKWHYLDASAMVKLVFDEGDCQPLLNFFRTNSSYCATLMCVTEALSVLKGKWAGKKMSMEQYVESTYELVIYTQRRENQYDSKIVIDDADILNPGVYDEVRGIVEKHNLDLSDALQLHSILRGKFAHLIGGSASVLITADKGLAKAATVEGVRVWNCIVDAVPNWD